jgi:hypothetical protein
MTCVAENLDFRVPNLNENDRKSAPLFKEATKTIILCLPFIYSISESESTKLSFGDQLEGSPEALGTTVSKGTKLSP